MKKVILMLAVAAMASCSKSEVETRPVETGDVEIKAGSTVLSIETKAPFEGITSTNTLTAHVIASKSQTDYVTADAAGTPGKWCAGKMIFGSGTNVGDAVGFDGDPKYYYPADNSSLYMVALVPSDDTKWQITGTSTMGVIEIDGQTDIMAAAVTKMNDDTSLIQKDNASATVYPTFKFNHLLTKLDIHVEADKAAVDAFGKITKLELKDAKNSCTVTLDGAKAVVDGSTSAFTATSTTTCPFYRYDYSTSKYTEKAVDGTADDNKIDLNDIVTNQSGEAQVAYAMVNPVWVGASNKDNPYVLHIESEKGYKNEEVKFILKQQDNTDFLDKSTQGMQFDVTLVFKATEITASATVTSWEETPTGDSTVTVE